MSPAEPERRRTLAPRQLLPWAALLVAVLAGLAIAGAAGTPTRDLTRDPTAIGEMAPWKGSLSLVASMLWASVATSMVVAVMTHDDSVDRPYFLGLLGVVALLGLDDSLLLHEEVLPAVGVPEPAVVGVYAALVVAFVAWRRRRLTARHPAPLLAAAAGLAASATADVLFDALGVDGLTNVATIVEDGPKLWGLLALATFAALEARDARAGQGRV